jgi:uncharacterized protein
MNAETEFSELRQAIKHGDLAAVRHYLDRGGDVHTTDRNGWSLLLLAAGEGNTPIIRLLLDAGADVNQIWGNWYSPLVAAAIAGSVRAVKLLLERGAKTQIGGKLISEQLPVWGYENEKIRLLISQAGASSGLTSA